MSAFRNAIAFLPRRLGGLARSFRRAPMAYIILFASLGCTLYSWQYCTDLTQRLAASEFQNQAKEIDSWVRGRLELYIRELYGARGFISGSERVTRDEWARYFERESARSLPPGFLGVGYAERVASAERRAFVDSVRQDRSVLPEGYPGFDISPDSDRAEYYVIKYLSPEQPNRQLLGADVLASVERMRAVQKAFETGRVSATDALAGAGSPARFELYLPVFARGLSVETPELRKKAATGFVFCMLDLEDLLTQYFKEKADRSYIDLEIYDGELLTDNRLIYDRDRIGRAADFGYRPRFTAHTMISVGERVWSLNFMTAPGYPPDAREFLPLTVLCGGTVGSLLLFGILYSLAISRASALKLSELAALVESSDDAVISVGLDGTVLSWNPAAERIYGYKPGEIIGRSLDLLMPPSGAEELPMILERIKTEGRISYFETTRMRKDGTMLVVSETISSIRDSNGSLKGVSTIDRDVTHLKRVRELLDQSKDFYLTLFEQFPSMIWRSRVDGARDYFNKTWLTFSGRSAEQEAGGGWFSRVHPDDAERLMLIYRRAHEEKKAFEVEYRHRRSDDQYRWLVNHGIPFNGLDGRFSGYIGTCYDISDRKKTEADLRNSLDLLFSIVENIPNMIFLKEAGELRFELFNKAGEELIGFKREELIGKNDYDFFPKEQADFFTQKDYEVLREKIMKDIPEEFIQTRDRGSRVLHTKKVPILLDEKGRPTYLLGISEDITDQKRAEEALRESEQRLRAVLDNTTAVIYLKDTEGRFILVNRQFEKISGMSKAQIIGKDDRQIFSKKSADEFRENDIKVLRQGSAMEFEESLVRDGVTQTYISVKFPLNSASGQVYAVCGISTDITERKRSEEIVREAYAELVANDKKMRRTLTELEAAHAELKTTQSQLIRAEKFAALGKLSGIISHEFRNQLGVIRNSAYFIRMKMAPTDEKIRKHLDIIESEIEETDRIIENILMFAKKNKPELRLTDPGALLAESIRRADIPQSVTLVREIQPGLPPIRADEVLLTRVFLNIVNNAVQAIKNTGQLTVTAVKDGRSVDIRFVDTGIGIGVEDKKKIFDPLFSTKHHGTGLGLATAKILVEAHGGTIDVDSETGKGTAVIVRIPVAETA